MQGYQLTFFTQQDRKHHTLPVAHWLLEEARALGISGATLIPAADDAPVLDLNGPAGRLRGL